jgi:sugar-phosphatase
MLVEPHARTEALATIDAYEIEDVDKVTAVPGALELIMTMPTAVWAVVTSGTTPLATARLNAAGLRVPPVLVTADDVENGKPAPDGYLAAAAALGLRPQVTVVIEDSGSGVESARAAGVAAVVGVGDRALETDADIVVPDLRALSWNGTGIAARTGDLLRRAAPEPKTPPSDTCFARSDS